MRPLVHAGSRFALAHVSVERYLQDTHLSDGQALGDANINVKRYILGSLAVL